MQCAWLLCFCVRILACLHLCNDSGLCVFVQGFWFCICVFVYFCVCVLVYLCKGGLALERDAAETEQGLSGGAAEDWGR